MTLILCFHRLALQGLHLETARKQLSPRSLVHLLELAHRDMCTSLHCSSTLFASQARHCCTSGTCCGTHANQFGHLEVGRQKRNYSRGSLAACASGGGAHSLQMSDQHRSQTQEDAAFMSVALEEARQVAQNKPGNAGSSSVT